MTGLDSWLNQATRDLAKDSAAQVRTEIREHYESARETAMRDGAAGLEAERCALKRLGDAKTANRQYREVLLTATEARMLGEAQWEARAVCSRPWLLPMMSAAALFGAAAYLLSGDGTLAWILLLGGIAFGLIFAAPYLPIYTPWRGRIYRTVRWVVQFAALGLALQWSWTLFLCLWPLLWIEWTRGSIRRKLPVAEWPKQLYL